MAGKNCTGFAGKGIFIQTIDSLAYTTHHTRDCRRAGGLCNGACHANFQQLFTILQRIGWHRPRSRDGPVDCFLLSGMCIGGVERLLFFGDP